MGTVRAPGLRAPQLHSPGLLAAKLPPLDDDLERDIAETLAFVGVGASASGITQRIDELLDEGFGRIDPQPDIH